jgi:hypothetical protein
MIVEMLGIVACGLQMLTIKVAAWHRSDSE